MKRTYLLPLLVFSSSVMMFGCTKKHEELDLSGIHTTAAAQKETMAPTTTAVEVTTAAPSSETSQDSDVPSANVSAEIETFRDTSHGSVSIQYPVVSNLSDPKTQESVNKLLLTNATAISGSVTSGDSVTIDITCKVISIDRSRLTAVYKGTMQVQGSAYPTNVFYTNTIDLKQAKSLGFNDYSDAYTMAGYVMSDDVQFYQSTSELTTALLAHRASLSVEEYTQLFNQADFPLSSSEEGFFPPSFSYTHEGVLYFSIPVPHALGDYAIVTFNIDGK